MTVKWLLVFSCLLFLISSCKKNKDVSPTSIAKADSVVNISQPEKTTIAKFAVSNEFQNNMVVQRDKPLSIWGKATTNTEVNISISWSSGEYTAIADQNGNWAVVIPAAGANADPQTITCKVDDANSFTFSNVLIGDVWICAGQSNMVMQVAPISPFRGVINYDEEIQAAQYPLIRFQTILDDKNVGPLDTFRYAPLWRVCSPATVSNVSAVSYFFARKLQTTLNVPVGIIVSASDGTSCLDWYANGQYYGGMISPLVKLSIKGFIWYQGENDQHILPASLYTVLNTALIQYWRTAFAQGTLPFYLVQLAPFAEDYFDTNPIGGNLASDYLARFREAQARVLSTLGTDMAITMDVGDPTNIHPQNKKPVGERLALLALNNTYGLNIECHGPKYLSYLQSGNKLTITYTGDTADGLNTIDNSPLNQLFFVAGADGIFYNAPAVINGNTVILTIPSTIKGSVVAIRYAFTSSAITNLQNAAGLPAEPFRTDGW